MNLSITWLVILCVLFFGSLLTFYFTRQIVGKRDRLFIALKIITFIIAFACVILVVIEPKFMTR
ncbi:MAG: hypothetical protein FWE45_03590 [Firmicutes bacterium]|nr:hypothetical protein [Bacillota bacterium]